MSSCTSLDLCNLESTKSTSVEEQRMKNNDGRAVVTQFSRIPRGAYSLTWRSLKSFVTLCATDALLFVPVQTPSSR